MTYKVPFITVNTRDVRNELHIVLNLDIHVGHDKNLSRFIQGLHNGV